MARFSVMLAFLTLSGVPHTLGELKIPELKLPELKLPEFKLPELGARDAGSAPSLKDFKIANLAKCAPNIFVEAESNFDTFYKRWWVNPNYVLPGVIRGALGNVLSGLLSTQIPVVGSVIADLLLDASDNAPPKRRPVSDLMSNALKLPKEVKSLIGILNDSAFVILKSPCVQGKEEPMSKEDADAEMKRIRQKYIELAKVAIQGVDFTLKSPAKMAQLLIPHPPKLV